MRELLWTEVNEHARYFSEYEQGQQTAATSTTIFKKSEHIYRIYSSKMTGINRHSGNRWYRWKRHTTVGFRRNHNGTLIGYHMYGNQPGFNDYTWSILLPRRYEQSADAPFREAVRKEFDLTDFRQVYPVARHYGLEQYNQMPALIRGAFRANSSREFVEKVFGKRHYRRDLLKATAEVDPRVLTVARGFRGLVPTDWIVNFLRLEHRVNHNDPDADMNYDLKKILREVDPRSYRRLLATPLDYNSLFFLRDATRQMAEHGHIAEDRYYRNWVELHDRNTVHRHHAINRFEDQAIPLTQAAKDIAVTVGNLEIVPAPHTSIMIEWGEKMHNCIAGYRRDAVAGSGVYAGIYENGKLIANLEIRSRKLVQLLGPCNQGLPKDKNLLIEKTLVNSGNIDVRSYWGKNGQLL